MGIHNLVQRSMATDKLSPCWLPYPKLGEDIFYFKDALLTASRSKLNDVADAFVNVLARVDDKWSYNSFEELEQRMSRFRKEHGIADGESFDWNKSPHHKAAIVETFSSYNDGLGIVVCREENGLPVRSLQAKGKRPSEEIHRVPIRWGSAAVC